MSDFNVDYIIELVQGGNSVPEEHLVPLLIKLMEILYDENNVLELTSPITICGDIHGQLYDLFQLFTAAAGDDIGSQKFLFMGDYVDRGRFSIETFAYLASLKIKYPGQFYFLRGNHECRQVNQMYGFYNETQVVYGHAGVWSLCNDLFDLLPMAALIDGKVFSVHGGLSPKINLIESISILKRQTELPSNGPLCDLCWSDPEEIDTWRKNQRGAGWLFGKSQVEKFCYNNKLDLITRSHQLAMEGYKWFFDNLLITVWSAPNYMYRSNNKACVLKYHPSSPSENGPYDIVMFEPMAEDKRKIPDDPVTNSPYFL